MLRNCKPRWGPAEGVPGSCFSRRLSILAGLVVTKGLAVTGELGLVGFFRFFRITFFFRTTRIQVCCFTVPRDSIKTDAFHETPDGKVCPAGRHASIKGPWLLASKSLQSASPPISLVPYVDGQLRRRSAGSFSRDKLVPCPTKPLTTCLYHLPKASLS